MSTGQFTMRDERRIVTAVFADVVGSTAVTERLDPEDARDVVGGAVACVIEQVDALGGTIKDLAGDGVLALFGAPVAHEDDAERAVLCGLRIVDAVRDHAADVAERWGVSGLAVRVGIETGRAVLGPVGGGSHIEYGATGDVLNIAARLQSMAEPSTVLVGAQTRAMTGDAFTWAAPQLLTLKGKLDPVDAAAALSYSPRRRSASLRTTRMVGRDDELRTLTAVAEDLAGGSGRVVALVGDAGTGKTRLVQEVHDLISSARWVEAGTASHSSAVPLRPIRQLVLDWLGLAGTSSPQEALAAVETEYVDRDDIAAAARAAVTALWEPPVVGADAARTLARVSAAVHELATALTRDRPLVLLLEDLHWMDSPSAEIVTGLVGLTRSRPLLLIVTMRPTSRAVDMLDMLDALARSSGGGLLRIDLGPLPTTADRELLEELVHGAQLPHQLQERLLASTDGNPYFLREQVRGLITAGALDEVDGGLRFTGRAELALAPTVERALVARIDRLPDRDRDVLLAASVLGPLFTVELIGAVMTGDCAESVESLEAGDFIARAEPAHTSSGLYRFRHALLQEAAYSTLLRRQRRELHARAAGALEVAYAGRLREIAATLGRHLAAAGDSSRAVDHLLVAAGDALATSANQEAAALAHDAYGLLDPSGSALDRGRADQALGMEAEASALLARYDDALACRAAQLELVAASDILGGVRLRCRIADLLQLAHRYTDALTELERADRALSDLDGVEAFDAWLDVVLARGEIFYWTADQEGYDALLGFALPVVEQRGTQAQRVRFFRSVMSAMWRQRNYVIDDQLLELDRQLYESDRAHPDESVRAWATFHHAFTLLWHRDLDEARRLLVEALDSAQRLGSVLLQARCLAYLLVTARLSGDPAEAARLLDDVRTMAREAALPEYAAIADATSGWIAVRAGDLDRAWADSASALAAWEGGPPRYTFDWMAGFPLLEVAVRRDDAGSAHDMAARMLAPEQQPLPEEVAGPLRRALTHRSPEDDARALAAYAEALEPAHRLNYA